jgi:putative endonuclease
VNQRLKHYRKGIIAEWLALLFLCLHGYLPYRWRMRTPVGEIDLIMQRGNMLIFVEVKARHSVAEALRAVTPNNQQRVARAAQWLLASSPMLAQRNCRFDVVAIPWYLWPKHLRNAF